MLFTITDLHYAIGDKVILDGINMTMEDKDKIALVGLNGAGKSTLLKLIAKGDNPAISYRKDLQISYLPQYSDFDEALTVYAQATKMAPKAQDYEIKATLTRFGLDDPDQKISVLSGGQKKRLALSIALLKECDLLILDEPTNHLDTPMIEYLEKYLIKRNKGLLMVTHDRYFLERITNKIDEIDRGSLYEYVANYSQFLEMKAEREAQALAAQHKRKQFLKKELEWVRAGVQARSTKSKDRLQRFEKLSAISDIKENENLTMIDVASRIGKKTMILDQVSAYYGDNVLFAPFSYTFKRFDRIGILGKNGCGKSTLMNIIAKENPNYTGTITYGDTIKIGYFKQGVEAMDMSMRVIDYIKETSDALITSEGVLTATHMCERFLFDKGMQYTAIGRLSGGERRRLYLLKVLMEGPNVLLLDEPTNDLDIETLTILEDYLDSFAGIVVTVSHDRYFLDKIVDGLFVFKDKQITYVNGGYSAAIDISDTQKEKASNYEAYKKQKQANKTRKLTWNEKKELEGMDDLLLSLEARIKAIDEEMGSLDDFKKMDELAQKRAALEQELDEKNERYLELMEIEEGQ